MPFLIAGGHRLDAEVVPPAHPDRPMVVFLHEGLGSRLQWKDFPARVRQALGVGTVVYSRWGYGASDPRAGDWPASFMHDEALTSLPEVLAAANVTQPPVLYGHSDGGSIALIFAAHYPDAVRAIVTEAAHVVVEDLTVARIASVRQRFAERAQFARFARHHGDHAEALWSGWSGAWLSPAFRRWDIRPVLARVACPVLAIQGCDDEFGTPNQLRAIEAGVTGHVTGLMVESCGHAPHAERPDAVVAALVSFLASC
ncbi:MAG: alpha/beta hydrolase [Acidobacteriota bacterium]